MIPVPTPTLMCHPLRTRIALAVARYLHRVFVLTTIWVVFILFIDGTATTRILLGWVLCLRVLTIIFPRALSIIFPLDEILTDPSAAQGPSDACVRFPGPVGTRHRRTVSTLHSL